MIKKEYDLVLYLFLTNQKKVFHPHQQQLKESILALCKKNQLFNQKQGISMNHLMRSEFPQ